MRKSLASLGIAGALLGSSAGIAGAQETAGEFELSPLNDSGATGTAEVALEGTMLRVAITTDGMVPDAPHAQHIHFQPGQASECPSPEAAGDDDVLTTSEGQPAYGPIQIPLTTEGDFGADSALALDRFPTADDTGQLVYERTFELSPQMVEMLAGQTFAIVQHGVDLDDSGMYDGEPSELSPDVPAEGTAPANCGTFTLAAAEQPGTTTTTAPPAPTTPTTMPAPGGDTDTGAMPSGGMDTGAGGTAVDADGASGTATTTTVAAMAAIALAGGGAVLARSRRDSA